VIWALDVFPTHAENIVAVISLGLVCIVQAIALSVAGRRIWEQKQQQQNAAQHTSRPPNEPQTKIASADPATAQPSSNNEQHQTKEEVFWNRQIDTAKGLNYITLGAASVAIVGLIFVSRSIEHADQGNVDTNRAWISTFAPTFYEVAMNNRPVKVQVEYENVGRQPAIDVKYSTFFDEEGWPENGDFTKTSLVPETTCQEFPPKEPLGMVFPSPQQKGHSFLKNGSEHQGFPQLGPRQGASLWGLRHRAESGSGQCGGHPRHGRVCRGKHSALVAPGRETALSGSEKTAHLRRQWR